jgi:6-pyruvoyltetrahydropterin/6-carboxytetrahydropterin synthase
VSVNGPIDPETGFVIDMKDLKDLIRSEVEDSFDHKNLNEEVEEFKELNPTAEHIAVVIWKRLRPHIQKDCDLEVQLFETPRNFVTYSG